MCPSIRRFAEPSAPFSDQNAAGGLPRFFDQRTIFGQVAKTECGHAALFLADQFAGTTEFEVGFGKGEAVGRLLQNSQPLACFASFWIGNQDAVRLVDAASDPSANLMKL